jgi:hypothetical protein
LRHRSADRSTSPEINLAAQVIQTPSRQPTGKRKPDASIASKIWTSGATSIAIPPRFTKLNIMMLKVVAEISSAEDFVFEIGETQLLIRDNTTSLRVKLNEVDLWNRALLFERLAKLNYLPNLPT